MSDTSITGGVDIEGARVLLPIYLATIDPSVVLPVTLVNATIEVGTVDMSENVGTIVDILGTVKDQIVGGFIDSIGTIDNAPLVTIQGTVDIAVLSGTVTIGDIVPGVTLPVTGSVVISGSSSILNTAVTGTVMKLEVYSPTIIATNQTYTASSTTTLVAEHLQNLVIDLVYGTVVTGSIQTSIYGVEPQSGIATSKLLSGQWDSGTVQYKERLQVSGPIGAQVALVTTVVGTVLNVYITAEMST